MPRTVRPPFKLRIKLREELQKFTMFILKYSHVK